MAQIIRTLPSKAMKMQAKYHRRKHDKAVERFNEAQKEAWMEYNLQSIIHEEGGHDHDHHD